MWILQTLSCENLFIHYECTSSQLTICHHFWVGATANPPKSDDIYVQLTRGAFILNDFIQNPHFRQQIIYFLKLTVQV